MSQPKMIVAARSARQERILSMVRTIFAQLMGVGAEELDDHKHFVEMGADSLFLLQVSQAIQSKFGIKLPFRVMLEEFSTLDLVAAYIDEQLPADESPRVEAPGAQQATTDEPLQHIEHLPESIAAEDPKPGAASPLERVLAQQLQVMTQQLELLRLRNGSGSQPQAAKPVEAQKNTSDAPPPTKIQEAPFVAYKPIRRDRTDGLNPRQREHIEGLIARVTAKTKGSKRIAAESRAALADNRATAGFRMLWKEMQYPLIADRASGSRLWDIDGNEYVDLTVGFGALLFGHSPSFIVSAIQKQIERGLQLGAESQLAGKAAALICELTGVERATFCNSGTEAVMSALRLARTVTGRTRIALFEGCYHGTFDGVMLRPGRDVNGQPRAVPLAPGVPEHMIENVLLLKLNDPASFDILRSQAHTLAAVLIEPMPSRFPDLRPEAFLRELRSITAEAGAALIFDEVITGFRFHPGGAQALFGVQADLVVYGKAAGAGIPVGVVAGRSLYMDAIDGGLWNYGDESYPRAETTFFAGTYFKHPLTMAAVWAALNHLKNSGPALQEELNRRTSRLADGLNSCFEEESLPARVSNYGSLFRFLFDPELKFTELFYYHLLEKGVYICETRSCFLSTAHTDRDVDFILSAVKETVAEMRAGDLLDLSSSESKTVGEAPRTEAQTVALTEAQRELWVLTQMGDDASIAYNESVALRLRGQFNPAAMRNAIQGVANRHEALRTTFSAEGTCQHIHTTMSIEVPLTDLSGLQGEEREEQIGEWCLREAQQAFDLVRGPLLRARIIKVDEDFHLLILTAHHIITDGMSNGIVIQEIGSLYSAYCRGETATLPEPMQYREYAGLQAELQNGEQMAAAESYWLEQFPHQFPILDLPADRPRPPLQTYAGGRLHSKIDKSALTALKNLGAQQQSTLFITLLAGYAALLHRLTDRREIVIGVPVAGQVMMGGRPLVGYCVNLVPFRSEVGDGTTFADFLKSVKTMWLDAYSHSHYPISRLMKKLDLPRDPGRAFPISAMFNLDRLSGLDLFGLETEAVANAPNSSKFDLYLNVTETDDELALCLEYNTDLLAAETVSRWLSHLTVLLNAAAVDPGRRVSELPILTESEERHLLVDWNETRRDYPGQSSIYRVFEEQVEAHPQAPAVICGDDRLSYQELNARANQMARYLRKVGVKSETVVGISVERSVEMVVDLLAILKAGGAYLPLDKENPAERLEHMLDESRVKVVIGKLGIEEKLRGRIDRLILRNEEEEEIGRQSRENLDVEVRADNLAYVMFTSGSTGRPKGIAVTHGGVVRLVRNNDYADFEAEVFLQLSPVSFDASTFEIWGALLNGSSLVLYPAERPSLEGLGEVVRRHKVTTVFLTTGLFHVAIDERIDELKPLKQIMTGGDVLSVPRVKKAVEQLGECRVIVAYGPAESTTFTTCWQPTDPAQIKSTVSIGRPIANTEVYILDRELRPVPIAVAGELCVGGDGLARCYINRPNLTAERFIPHPFSSEAGARLYRTGDLVRWMSDGKIEFLGRFDDQVKIRGFRIEMGEIETVLKEHGGIREAVVVARQGERGEKRLVAYVVERKGVELSEREVRSYLRERLPEYMVPNAVVVLDDVPLNENGKIDRRKLPEVEIRREEMEKEYVEPLSEAERKLAQIWVEVLQVEKIGVEDNFFELGGDSILAIQIATRAKLAGFHLTPKEIFEHPTIAELAEGRGAVLQARAEQGPVVGPVRLTPIQRWFFEQNLPHPHHFNQANLLTLEKPIDPAIVEKAVGELISHHDALRLRFVKEEEEWRQYSGAPDPVVPFTHIDLSEVPESELSTAIEAKSGELQASLNLSEGPIIRVALINPGSRRSSRLLIVIHHLAVDIVSWGIVLEDLTRACEQLSQGEKVSLPAKTTSFKQWAQKLEEAGRSEEVKRELGYWVSEKIRRVMSLPTDEERGENSEASARTIMVELGEEETRRLLHEASKAYRTQISDLLLAALGEGIRKWSGETRVLVDVEGHGREESLVPGVDLTRTVGWFTSVYPVLIEVGDREEETLKRVKEEMRRAPGGGVVYGLLRYQGRDEVVEKLRDLPQAQVSFNFMSRLAGTTEKFSFTEESYDSIGPSRDPSGHRRYLLEVNGIIIEGRIRISWTYSENRHHRETIEALNRDFVSSLRSLTDHCVNHASNASVAKVDERKLNKALEMVKF